MIKSQLFVFCFFANLLYAQTSNEAKAPNSYIYDIGLAESNNYGGIEIPVSKAYKMWASYEYLKTNGLPTPIPAGTQSGSLYWEDVPGLIRDVTIVPGADPSSAKLKVEINKGKGKGNAVVAFKVNGTIYWSWHIWVTDNPENGVFYQQGTETDVDGNLINIQYMDRNLGATSNGFLDNQWQKSGGLMYEWGRKDPFPPLVYKDAYFYEISGEVGVLKHREIDAINTIPVQIRPFNEIEKNIQYSVKNPITYIVNTEATGNWFSSSRYKVAGASPDYVNWDLWSDNAKGLNSNGNSSNAALKKESRSYELKSELDPCPSGWRIPSYYGRETMNNNLAFFGKKDWNNDDGNVNFRQIFPNAVNANLDGIKVYPGLGMDFTNAQGGARNLGMLPVSGGYVYYPNSAAPNAPIGVIFQDNNANGGLWSSTFSYDGARIFSMISDPFRTNTNVGLHAIYNNQTNPTKAGNAVKCMRDPNLLKIGDFATQYFTSEKEDFVEGLDNPNSYVMFNNETSVRIPVNKAFSVYNQLLSDQEMLPYENLVVKVLWTSNTKLVTSLELDEHPKDGRMSFIDVGVNPTIKGNAVISLHHENPNTPALWSWHIWATDGDPTENAVTYVTENPIPVSYNFVNATASKIPPMKTVFMDRNLGAESSSLESGKANGLHYQWGRKDPMPIFKDAYLDLVYVFTDDIPDFTPPFLSRGRNFNYNSLSAENFLRNHTELYANYGSKNPNKHKKERENIIYSIKNPLMFMYQTGFGNIYDGGNHYGNDLKKVRDWISNDRASADNRWGHADKKSPFDPCPEGWRVPDVTLTNLYSGSKGSSPWYNGYQNDAYGKSGVIQDQWHDISNFYSGSVAGSEGWKFENSLFPLGKYPKDGIRGEVGENEVFFDRSGVWTASMADYNTGFALAMQFQGNKMQTGTGVYPQAGMSVRCAKDEKRLLGAPSGKNGPYIGKDIKETEPSLTIVNNEINLYPNPFKDQFNIQNKNAESVQLYDLSGKLVLTSKIVDGSVTASNLPNGLYIVKILMKDQSFVTKKLIKQ